MKWYALNKEYEYLKNLKKYLPYRFTIDMSQ